MGPGSVPRSGTTLGWLSQCGSPEALGELEPDPAEQDALRLIRNGHAAKPDASAGAGGQDHAAERDPGQLVDDGSGAASHPML